jgi:hypothetical protein
MEIGIRKNLTRRKHKMRDDNKLRKMVREMLDAEDKGFSDWEIDFLDGMLTKDYFTTNMADKIEQIYKKKM